MRSFVSMISSTTFSFGMLNPFFLHMLIGKPLSNPKSERRSLQTGNVTFLCWPPELCFCQNRLGKYLPLQILVYLWQVPRPYESRLHVQVRLLGNLGLNAGVPWPVSNNDPGALCFICKKNVEDVHQFFCECSAFKDNFDSIWSNLVLKIRSANLTEGVQISNFIKWLDHTYRIILLLGGLDLASFLSACRTFNNLKLTLIYWTLPLTGCRSALLKQGITVTKYLQSWMIYKY